MQSNYKSRYHICEGDKVTILRNDYFKEPEDLKFVGRTGIVVEKIPSQDSYLWKIFVPSLDTIAIFNRKEMFKLSL